MSRLGQSPDDAGKGFGVFAADPCARIGPNRDKTQFHRLPIGGPPCVGAIVGFDLLVGVDAVADAHIADDALLDLRPDRIDLGRAGKAHRRAAFGAVNRGRLDHANDGGQRIGVVGVENRGAAVQAVHADVRRVQ